MFDKIKEKREQREAAYRQHLEEERRKLLELSEKELLVEVLMRLEVLSNQLDQLDRTVQLYSSD